VHTGGMASVTPFKISPGSLFAGSGGSRQKRDFFWPVLSGGEAPA